MRIVHINLERSWRGGERQVLYLMEGLGRLGHECRLVARRNEGFVSRVAARGIPVHIVSKPYLLHGSLLSRFDVVHAHETRGLQMAAAWKGFNGLPLVFTRRVDNPPTRNPLTRFIYGKIDRMAAISGAIGKVMTAWGFDPARIRMIPSAVETDREPRVETVSMLRERFGGKKVVGCVASLEKRKDHQTLLLAASVIRRQMPDVVFVLVGDGAMRRELEEEAKRLGLTNIVFEGYREDPYPYYGLFDLFVMTSKQEGLGSAILDAFAHNVPVVATAAGGIPEIVRDGQTGLLVDVGSATQVAGAIMKMLGDDGLRRRCTGSARDLVVEGYSIDGMARAYERIYREVTIHG
ncbi:MAG TPA: glycosyltransferase family 4 protein [Deltaproteobacteria bacterium]|nr:glycosyltransferase family 4 protein [Deltaproteobacteria bacterium]HPR54815.1 glycosyltransferase family 4 protein [Deltaproteobacteria bacterium]HXK46560.1 glycosyltransferase family 4 protein [Deltaproteobacteria bacterium]